MELASIPESLVCSECEEGIADTGYLPATEREGGYEPRPEEAVCGSCGFNEIGMMGCAPELDEVIDPEPDDVLLHVRVTEDGIDALSAKD